MKKNFVLFSLLSLSLYGFSGVVVDATTKKPIMGATITNSSTIAYSSISGNFTLDSNETTYSVKAYGYKPFHGKNKNIFSEIYLKPIEVKALYLSFWNASNNSKKLKHILDIIDSTQLNSIVVDVKNEYGLTSFRTSFAQANSYGADKQRTNKNIKKFMQELKKRKIYTIARIVTFKDELQAQNNPEYAVRENNGTIWRNHDGMAWVDPFDKRSHKYAISIAEEAAKVGFDEINFDYIRFPAKSSLIFSKKNTQENRVKAIESFLALAKKRLQKYGVYISVDTYGNVCWSKDDCNIGQTIPSLIKYADYLSPMLYPSGFASGSFRVKYPAEHPYKVIYNSIANIEDEVNPIRIRPWLQHFKDYTYTKKHYKKKEISAQIQATKDLKTGGWLMWSPTNRYYKDYFH